MPKAFYRVMLGRGSMYATQCREGQFIGIDGIPFDLAGQLTDDWREFNRYFVPRFLEANPGRSRIAAGLASGMTWTVCRGIQRGDVLLCPDGAGRYFVGEVVGDYRWVPGEVLQHRRDVRWLDGTVDRASMSDALRASTGFTGTVCDISRFADEIERLICGNPAGAAAMAAEAVEEAVSFQMEKHLEEFLVRNWAATELGARYDIYQDEDERSGQQYPTDTGPMDILAVSRDRRELLVVELKRGRASDSVVGQVLRYMGFVKQELAEPDQLVRGAIIALEDDPRIRRALAVTPDITFYRYQIRFELIRQ